MRSVGCGAGACFMCPVFVQFALRWGRNWAAQWHLAGAVGRRFGGCRAKRLYVYMFFRSTSRFSSVSLTGSAQARWHVAVAMAMARPRKCARKYCDGCSMLEANWPPQGKAVTVQVTGNSASKPETNRLKAHQSATARGYTSSSTRRPRRRRRATRGAAPSPAAAPGRRQSSRPPGSPRPLTMALPAARFRSRFRSRPRPSPRPAPPRPAAPAPGGPGPRGGPPPGRSRATPATPPSRPRIAGSGRAAQMAAPAPAPAEPSPCPRAAATRARGGAGRRRRGRSSGRASAGSWPRPRTTSAGRQEPRSPP